MGLVDELAKLDELHRNGGLSDAEFAAAKSALLQATIAPPYISVHDNHFRENVTLKIAELTLRNELADMDRQWEVESRQYLFRGIPGALPVRGVGIASAAFGGAFGAFWAIMTFAIMYGGPFPIFAKAFFPFLGIAIAIGGYKYRS